MGNRALVSLAILKVNSDVLGKDYLETFVPIVAECIRTSQSDLVSLQDLQRQVRRKFGLQVPQNAIRAILNRARRRGYIKAERGFFIRVMPVLEGLNFHAVQQRVLAMHEAVIGHLATFSSARFGQKWTEEEAESAFQAYIEEHQLDIVSYSIDSPPLIVPPTHDVKGSKYIVGAFVQHLYESQAADIEYLECIVKGNLLANAIFFTDPSKTSMAFRKTEVYFDTSFLINVLGYAGDARRDPCVELLDLLYENGAELRCFSHTMDETRGVLEACAYRIGQGQLADAYGPSIEYFITTNHSPSDIELLAVNLEKDLAGLRIQAIEKPPFDIYEHVIDEKGLYQKLVENIAYHNPETAAQRDVDSISAIMRLRRGQTCSTIEESRALFVTTNNALVRNSREFFNAEISPGAIPPCIPDFVLTNLLWVKKPLRAPDLPRKRIIADYYAATQPQERLWGCYLGEVTKLQERKQITADDYYLLRHSLEAKSALMEVTLGEEEAFTQGSIAEILDLVRSRVQAEKDAEIKKKDEQLEIAERAVQSLQSEEKERKVRIRNRAQEYAGRVSKLIKFFLLAGLIVGTASTFPWGLPAFNTAPASYLVAIIQLALLILVVCNLMYGTYLDMLVRKIEIRLSEWLEGKMATFLGG